MLRVHCLALSVLLVFPAGAAAADTATSQNWAGYAIDGTFFKRVSASWIVPQGACTAGAASFSAIWVGLGGFEDTSESLEQTGTEFDCDASGRASYSAWYELVPVAGRTLHMRVRPGDKIDAAVTVSGTRVTLLLRNRTRHVTFRRTTMMSAPDTSSAEWIVEAPSDCDTSGNACHQLPLSNFGSATFRRASATSAGAHVGTIADGAWSLTRIDLDQSGSGPRFGPAGPADVTSAAGASPGDLAAGGSSFSVAYGAS